MTEYEMQLFLVENGYLEEHGLTREEFMDDDCYMFDGAADLGYISILDEETETYTFHTLT